MIIDIRELRERGEPSYVHADFSEGELRIRTQTVSLIGPAHADLKVSLSGERLRVKGHLEAQLEVVCSRCLRPAGLRVDKDVDLEYWPDPVVTEGEEIALRYEELTIGFYREDQLDLNAVISEQIVLEVPMKPVCREECRGLCPYCGIDLNETQCSCHQETVDPRLEVLLDLKRKLK